MLIRNVTYEIPALKKQTAKCQQIQTVSEIYQLRPQWSDRINNFFWSVYKLYGAPQL